MFTLRTFTLQWFTYLFMSLFIIVGLCHIYTCAPYKVTSKHWQCVCCCCNTHTCMYMGETSVVFHLYNTHIRPITHVLTIYMAFLLPLHTNTQIYSCNRSDMSLKLLLLGCLLSNLDNFFINVFRQMVSYWILLLADELYVELDTYIDKGDTNQKRLDFVFLSFFSFFRFFSRKGKQKSHIILHVFEIPLVICHPWRRITG